MSHGKILLVGQAPGPNTSPRHPLFPVPATSTGGRLQRLMGIKRHEYMARFDRVNLLQEFPGRHKRDDKFPMRDARIAAAAMGPLLAGRRVCLVGRNVALAFGYDQDGLPWHEWRLCTELNAVVACIPHPSGRNHWYNCKENQATARSFWAAVMN